MKNELESLRDKLYNMLNSNKYDYEEILKTSEDLDKLIIIYYENVNKHIY